jgi:hypothetical protein
MKPSLLTVLAIVYLAVTGSVATFPTWESRTKGLDDTIPWSMRHPGRRALSHSPDGEHHPDIIAMNIANVHHGRTPVRRLSESTCTEVAAAAGIDLAQFSSSNLRMSSQVARQNNNGNGTILSFAGVTVDASATNGGLVGGCGGISQSGNRPGTNGTYTRSAIFNVHPPVYAFTKELVGFLPPHIATMEVPVFDAPAPTNISANSLPITNAYLQSLQQLLETLVREEVTGRRLSTHDPQRARDVILALTAKLQEAKLSAWSSGANDAESRAFRNSGGLTPLDVLDPLSGFQATHHTHVRAHDGHSTRRLHMDDLPYVTHDTWTQSKAAAGDHPVVRMTWCILVSETRGGDTTRSLRHLVEDSRHPFHADMETYFTSAPLHARRSLTWSAVAAAGALVISGAALSLAIYNTVRITALDNKLTSLESSVNNLISTGNELAQTGQGLGYIMGNQSAQIRQAQYAAGNNTASLAAINEWKQNATENQQSNLKLSQQLSNTLAKQISDTNTRFAQLATNVTNANAALLGILRDATDTCERHLNDTARTVALAVENIMAALGEITLNTDTRLKALGNHITIAGRQYNKIVRLMGTILQRPGMQAELTAATYDAYATIAASGWRPLISEASADPSNRPTRLDVWQPGSPNRRLVVDSLMIFRTHRVPDDRGVYPSVDVYSPWVPGPGPQDVTAQANHRVLEDTLTLMCDPVVIMDAVSQESTISEVFDMLGYSDECVTPLTGITAEEFTGNYTTVGAPRVFNPTNAPLCACWVVHRARSCPVVLRNATHAILDTAFNSPHRVTFNGLDGVTQDGVRHLTPCTTDSTPSVDNITTIKSREALAELLAKLSCDDVRMQRNVTAGRAAARAAGNADLAARLTDAFVFDLKLTMKISPEVMTLTTNGTVVPATGIQTAIAFGAPVAPNPRVVGAGGMLAPGTSTCSGEIDESSQYPFPTVTTTVAALLGMTWSYAMFDLAGVRQAVYGVHTADMAFRSVPNVDDPVSRTTFFAMYSRFTAIQDVNARWVPVWKLRRTGTVFSSATIFMDGVEPTEPGATNGIPAFSATTTNIETYAPAGSLIPFEMVVVGDIDTCIADPCEIPNMGLALDAETATTRVPQIYNPRQSDISLSSNKNLAKNKIGYIMNTETGVVDGTYIAHTMTYTADTFRNQTNGQVMDTTATAGSIGPFIRGLNGVPDGVSKTDVYCPGRTSVDEGDICLLFEHAVWLTADTTGRNRALDNTPYEGCGTSLVCLSPRVYLQRIHFDVPGGMLTQTLGNTCPFADVSPQGMGLSTISVTVPPTAASAVAWNYAFVCNGVNDDIDDAATPLHERVAMCDAAATPFFVSGGTLEASVTTRIPFQSPVANWTMHLQVVNPATGLFAACRPVQFVRKIQSEAPLFGLTNVVFAPVLSNERIGGQVSALTAIMQQLSDATLRIITSVTIKTDFLALINGESERFAELQRQLSNYSFSDIDASNYTAARADLLNGSADARREAERLIEEYKNISRGYLALAEKAGNDSATLDRRLNETISNAKAALSKMEDLQKNVDLQLLSVWHHLGNATEFLNRAQLDLWRAGNITTDILGDVDFLGFVSDAVEGAIDLGKQLLDATTGIGDIFGDWMSILRGAIRMGLYLLFYGVVFYGLFKLYRCVFSTKRASGYTRADTTV